MKRTTKFILVTLIGLFTIFADSAMALDVVASMGRLNGSVKVLRDTRNIAAKEGLILYDKDVVITSRRARATIIFRDGSEIRLFQDTKFVIEKSEESKAGNRKFMNSFKVNLGSLWGRFTKDRQNTSITTPTATIGIKGTNLTINQRNGEMDLSLSAGRISVANYDETIMLDSGYKLMGVKSDGKISDKKSQLTYQISFKPDKGVIHIPTKGEEQEVTFSIQLINSATKRNYNKSGNVYLTSDVDKLQFPKTVKLNKRGYARIKATILPFQKSDYGDGKLTVFAVMDGNEFMDIGAGKALLTFDIPEDIKRTIQINMDSGEISK